MDNKFFIRQMTTILQPYGFKKHRTNRWIYEGEEISEVIELQKSYISNLYYFMYGFMINAISPQHPNIHGHLDVMKMGGMSMEEWKELQQLCDLETGMDEELRISRIKRLVGLMLKSIQGKIDTEEKAKQYLVESRLPLPYYIINYFNLKS